MCREWENRRKIIILLFIIMSVLNVTFAHLCEQEINTRVYKEERNVIIDGEHSEVEYHTVEVVDPERPARLRRVYLGAAIGVHVLACALIFAGCLTKKMQVRKNDAYYLFWGNLLLVLLSLGVGRLVLNEEFRSLLRYVWCTIAAGLAVSTRMYLMPKLPQIELPDESELDAIKREEWLREHVSRGR